MLAEAPATERSGISSGLVLILAASCGIVVANLYYAQPMLDTLARVFRVGSAQAGLVTTFSQVGYAIGLALLVPLGDSVDRRRFVPLLLVATAVALAASALAPGIAVLIALALVIGLGSVAVQILLPMAAGLASDSRRGRVIGTIMTGVLLGILLARTVSGLVAGVAGWRVMYAVATVLVLAVAVTLWRVLPGEGERERLHLGKLLGSMAGLVASQPVLRRRMLLGGLGFCAFSVFWTTMAFLLARPPYHYGEAVIGLFGLVGAAGALIANVAGREVDRGHGSRSTILFTACIAGSFALLLAGSASLAALIAGIVVLDIGVQGLQVTNQNIVFAIVPAARSRVNACYMVAYFVGGALGSALAGAAYAAAAWPAVCALGALVGVLAMAVWAFDRMVSRRVG
ncbi:MAG TPA: MFS transporter [Candidatus Dormibacteraeota bacterium]|jgi:predicted MFS family arabinose efflux permease|nr:MFS transporter [Candidatus Dormibacteraeota bacterium]